MSSVWRELKRRKVVKVAVAYAIVGWLVIEVASTVFPALQLPDWTVTFVTMLLLLGFPLALILSWAYDITPEGVKRSDAVSAAESVTHSTGRKLDFAIIGALVLALGFVVYNYVLEDDGSDELPATAVTEPEPGVLPNSVAVLPFENLSLDPENAFFAAGIHEEVLNQLAKVRALSVIARTSMMQYADGTKSIPEVAEELNVETVMEGSVRYADDRVLVTAQLIDAATNVHLWSESYNREFSDIFAIQADIAMNIANALEAEFSLVEQASIERPSTTSPEAYALYLRARQYLIGVGDGEDIMSALDQAIEIDPEFAEAYAFRATALATVGRPFNPDDVHRALDLDPALASAHALLGFLHESEGRPIEAEQAYDEAYRLSPNDFEVLQRRARFLRNRGDYPEAIRMLERAVAINPSDFQTHHQLGISYRYNGEYDKSVAAAVRAIEPDPSNPTPHTGLAYTEVARGDFDVAERELRLAEQLGVLQELFRLPQMAYAYSRMGRPDEASRLFEQFEQRADAEGANDGEWAMMYLAMGESDMALQRLEAAVQNSAVNSLTLAQIRADTYQDPVLEEPRFRALRDQIGQL